MVYGIIPAQWHCLGIGYMRTEEFKDFDTKLSTTNKNFSHGLFLSEQFLIDNAQLIAERGEALSRDIYTSNRYREKFNYRLKSLQRRLKSIKKPHSLASMCSYILLLRCILKTWLLWSLIYFHLVCTNLIKRASWTPFSEVWVQIVDNISIKVKPIQWITSG
jgi:hypothetical protein